jgi:hypothetical protein
MRRSWRDFEQVERDEHGEKRRTSFYQRLQYRKKRIKSVNGFREKVALCGLETSVIVEKHGLTPVSWRDESLGSGSLA